MPEKLTAELKVREGGGSQAENPGWAEGFCGSWLCMETDPSPAPSLPTCAWLVTTYGFLLQGQRHRPAALSVELALGSGCPRLV